MQLKCGNMQVHLDSNYAKQGICCVALSKWLLQQKKEDPIFQNGCFLKLIEGSLSYQFL